MPGDVRVLAKGPRVGSALLCDDVSLNRTA